MTVSTTQVRVSYTGDGVSVNFATSFAFYASTDLLVVQDGVTKTLAADYTVTGGNGALGTVVMNVAPAVGINLQVILNPPLTQTVALVDGTAFPAATLNQQADRGIQIDLRLDDKISRTLRVADGTDVNPSLILPNIAARAGKYMAFDGAGAPVPSVGTGNDTALRTDLAATVSGADGSRLVGFRRTETGSVVQSVYASLTRRKNVMDFDVLGDNAHDDAPGWQAALNAISTGGRLYVPGGHTYKFLSGVLLPGAGIEIEGDDNWSTVVNYQGAAGSVFSMLGLGSSNSFCALRAFAITLKNAADIAINMTSLGESVVERMRVYGGANFAGRQGTAVKVSSASASAYRNEFCFNDFQNCTNGYWFTSGANQQNIWGGQANSCSAGILMDGVGASLSDHIQVWGTRLENNVRGADVRDWNILGFHGVRFEKNADGTYGLYYTGGSASLLPLMVDCCNGFHSYAGGNDIFNNGATGRILVTPIGANNYDDLTGLGARHLGLGALHIGNLGSAVGPTLQAEGSAADADFTILPKGAGRMMSQNVGLAAATPTGSGAQVSFGNTVSTTIGAAGAASALPANPVGYLSIDIGGNKRKIPYYNP